MVSSVIVDVECVLATTSRMAVGDFDSRSAPRPIAADRPPAAEAAGAGWDCAREPSTDAVVARHARSSTTHNWITAAPPLGDAVRANTMYDISQFPASDMTRCGAELRKAGMGAGSMEDAANR